ncbi:hypothetical protein EVAR_19687_1 [Eumeta japonica]|uniref:Uncharacterized protein n=1 Tax=Eumeta variegata TaxID=151549 RepID=A0A4C1V3N5_EUMVA|nr:hypothetical protein EVAR_19687_1 [Eumeta japonica]
MRGGNKQYDSRASGGRRGATDLGFDGSGNTVQRTKLCRCEVHYETVAIVQNKRWRRERKGQRALYLHSISLKSNSERQSIREAVTGTPGTGGVARRSSTDLELVDSDQQHARAGDNRRGQGRRYGPRARRQRAAAMRTPETSGVTRKGATGLGLGDSERQ